MGNSDSPLRMQRGEITEYWIYSALARKTGDEKNRDILAQIARDEKTHYGLLKKLTGQDVGPDRLKVSWYVFLASTLGLTFALKLMEKGEGGAQSAYHTLKKEHPELEAVLKDEERHEKELLGMISEERLEYASSVVLGLNDAIVEFTGTLAGLTFAIGDGKLIGITGLIMGVAAALSMGASGYLSAKEEKNGKDPVKSFAYTAGTYMITVLVVVSPYFILPNVYAALGLLLAFTVFIIAAYSFYMTTAKDQDFKTKFFEMAGMSFGVAVISFIFGLILKKYVGGA